ncbi:MAG: hypothetical protein QX190_02545 [Methylococcales bacterium]
MNWITVVWFKQKQQVTHLFFAITALGIAVMNGMELVFMRSVSIHQVILLMRELHVPMLVICMYVTASMLGVYGWRGRRAVCEYSRLF